MQFVRDGELLGVVRITGPTHNLLFVHLVEGSAAETTVECLPAIGPSERAVLDEAALVKAVLDGVAQANRQHATTYAVSHVRYVQDDSKPESAYAFLARQIVERSIGGGVFGASPNPSFERTPDGAAQVKR
jgi:hypothetical protein